MEEISREEVQLDGTRVTVTLNHGGIINWQGDKQGSVVIKNDLIGFTSTESSITLYTFKLSKSSRMCGKSVNRRVRKDLVMKFTNDAAHRLWCNNIQQFLDESAMTQVVGNVTGRPKKLLVVVNPFGGGRVGMKVFSQTVEPLLKASGITYTMRETQFHRHGKDLAKSFDIAQFDGIVCVSGDGVLVEVLNGLLERQDWEHAINLPIGIIPAGTGNGMAKSILEYAGEPCNAANATFLIIRGEKNALDVATVTQGQVRFHSILMLTWGLVADVDFESEKLRWLGAFRLDVYSMIRIFNLRRYNGSFAYIPAPGNVGTGGPCSGEHEVSQLLQNAEMDSDRSWRKSGYSGPLQTPPSSEWRAMDGAFVLVWLNNVPFAGEHVMSAPNAKFSDGYLDMVVVKDCPRLALLNLLLKINTGGHIKSKYVEYLKVKAFRLAPGGRYGSDTQGGYVDLDGEVLARGSGSIGNGSNDPMVYGPTIEVTMERALATIFCPA